MGQSQQKCCSGVPNLAGIVSDDDSDEEIEVEGKDELQKVNKKHPAKSACPTTAVLGSVCCKGSL